MSRRKEGRSPNRRTEKEAGDGIFKVTYLRCSCFRTIAMTYGGETSIINDDNWVDSVSLYRDAQVVSFFSACLDLSAWGNHAAFLTHRFLLYISVHLFMYAYMSY